VFLDSGELGFVSHHSQVQPLQIVAGDVVGHLDSSGRDRAEISRALPVAARRAGGCAAGDGPHGGAGVVGFPVGLVDLPSARREDGLCFHP
jgi:hypothetical protein